MERYFEEELKELKEKILYMGDIAGTMIDLAIASLKKKKDDFIDSIYQKEKEVNKLHIEIDEMCLRIIALRQPIAIDLRFIMAAVKINSDLERIGDQAVNIAENSSKLHEISDLKSMPDLDNMANISQKMLQDSLKAFINRDVELARTVVLTDDKVDDLKSKIFNDLKDVMRNDTSKVLSSLDFILIARNLERIADHATNIAEDVIFMVLGKDIRHHMEKQQ
ncbi:MAG: phosphate signaling complex protein PhoU [bacterium]|nr:phosphate signaling complex protein PhoU [bacterium]